MRPPEIQAKLFLRAFLFYRTKSPTRGPGLLPKNRYRPDVDLTLLINENILRVLVQAKTLKEIKEEQLR